MIIKSFLIVLPSLLAGFILINLFWKSLEPSALGLKVSIGIGLGVGITSCLYFLRMLLFHGQGGYLLIEMLFLVVVLAALFIQRRHDLRISFPFVEFNRISLLFGIAVILVTAITLYYLVTMARTLPHGDYDAQAIWNLRARFMYELGDEWEHSFSPLINRNFHMDYPLLIPMSVLGGWNALGGEVLRVPSLISMLFLFGLAGTLYFFICHLRSSTQAAIAVILLLATSRLLVISTFQTAEVPLMYFFLASATLLVLAQKENNHGLLFMAGMMAGLGAWTKNEGLPFMLLVLFCTFISFKAQQVRRWFFYIIGGMALPLLTIILFKTLISVNNDLFVDNGIRAIITKLFTLTRYVQIAGSLLSELRQLGGWSFSILLILLIYAVIMGGKVSVNTAENTIWVLALSQFLVYMLIYLITPHDLAWHTKYSMERLLLHIFPLALSAFFLFVNTPESVLNKVK
jgi:heme/copper-type cytochrome/quinol oxidase subunit 4